MQSTPISHSSQRGFTLIEMLVVAPLVVLLIGIIIAFIVSLTGDSLKMNEKSSLTYEAQNALSTIESTILTSARFLTTTSNLTSPFGLNDDTTNFSYSSSPNTLILTVPATTNNKTNPKLIYTYNVSYSECSGSAITKNPIATNTVVFFVKDGTLRKRTIADPGNWCQGTWQMPSCTHPDYDNYYCEVEDDKLADNVTGMTIDYYATADTGAPKLTSIVGPTIPANTAEIKLTLSKSVAGENINRTESIKVTRQNNINTDPVAPTTAPTVSYSIDNTTSVTFNWNTIPNATAYLVSYSLNGGAYTSPAAVTSNSYTISTVRSDTITLRVAAKNSYGTTGNGQATASVPSTIPCDLQNNWVNYGSPFAPATFTKTKLDVVALSGLIRSGTGVGNEVICTLPPGYRPSAKLIFAPATNGITQGRIDIEPTGEVKFNLGSTGWISLNGINFRADGASWTNIAGLNSWTSYGAQFATPQISQDSSGRVLIQGLAAGGTMGSTVAAFALPPSLNAVTTRDIYPARGNVTVGSMDVNTDKTVHYRSGGNGYWSMQAMYYPSSGTGTWTTMSLAAGWNTYAAPYSSAQYIKNTDGIVSLRGLIKGGTVTRDTVIATLPAGYRPVGKIVCSVVTNPNTYGRIDVLPNGQVLVVEGVNNGWLSLAGCDFLAEN